MLPLRQRSDASEAHEEWYAVLATCWSRGSIQRLYVISDVLIANDFYSWHQLDHATDFGGWLGMERLQEDDLKFLQDFMRRGKAAPRYIDGKQCHFIR